MFVSAEGAKLYATSFGSKSNPTIVAIGGWIGSWELWVEPFSLLSESFRTVAYDHRGSGVSFAAPETITHETLVRDLFTVLDAYEIKSCALAAESAGAQTALAAAIQAPERISHLIIVDGLYTGKNHQEADPFLQGLEFAYDDTLQQFVELCVPVENAEHIKHWGRQIINRATQKSAITLRKLSSSFDLVDQLVNIRQPTLIIHSDNDLIVPVKAAKVLANLIPNSELVVFEGAGHVPTLTQPDKVASVIANFLENK